MKAALKRLFSQFRERGKEARRRISPLPPTPGNQSRASWRGFAGQRPFGASPGGSHRWPKTGHVPQVHVPNAPESPSAMGGFGEISSPRKSPLRNWKKSQKKLKV